MAVRSPFGRYRTLAGERSPVEGYLPPEAGFAQGHGQKGGITSNVTTSPVSIRLADDAAACSGSALRETVADGQNGYVYCHAPHDVTHPEFGAVSQDRGERRGKIREGGQATTSLPCDTRNLKVQVIRSIVRSRPAAAACTRSSKRLVTPWKTSTRRRRRAAPAPPNPTATTKRPPRQRPGRDPKPHRHGYKPSRTAARRATGRSGGEGRSVHASGC